MERPHARSPSVSRHGRPWHWIGLRFGPVKGGYVQVLRRSLGRRLRRPGNAKPSMALGSRTTPAADEHVRRFGRPMNYDPGKG